MLFFSLNRVSVIRQKKSILKDISLTIQQNRSYGILGPSGAGKTTLLRCMNLMTIPTMGEIIYKGCNVLKNSITNHRRKVPMVFQEPVLFNGTVQNNLDYPFTLKQWKHERPTIKQYQKILSICQLNHSLLNMKSHSLSGGEKQRVAIARALLLQPEVLLMDEPTSAMDVETANRVIDSIQNEIQEITMIVVTHNLEIIQKMKEKIILKNGNLLQCCEQLTNAKIRRLLKE